MWKIAGCWGQLYTVLLLFVSIAGLCDGNISFPLYIYHLSEKFPIHPSWSLPPHPAPPPVGWSDFEGKNATLSMLCQIVVGPQLQNFMS